MLRAGASLCVELGERRRRLLLRGNLLRRGEGAALLSRRLAREKSNCPPSYQGEIVRLCLLLPRASASWARSCSASSFLSCGVGALNGRALSGEGPTETFLSAGVVAVLWGPSSFPAPGPSFCGTWPLA